MKRGLYLSLSLSLSLITQSMKRRRSSSRKCTNKSKPSHATIITTTTIDTLIFVIKKTYNSVFQRETERIHLLAFERMRGPKDRTYRAN